LLAEAKELAISMGYPADIDAPLYAEVTDFKIKTVDRHGKRGRASFAALMSLGLNKTTEKELSRALNLITDLATRKENWRPKKRRQYRTCAEGAEGG